MPVKIVPIPVLTPQQLSNFEAKIERIPFSECWLWSACRLKNGYGKFGVGGNGKWHTVLAHRVMYTLHYGPIPDGLIIMHTCHNGHLGCVTPWHLKAGTHDDNMEGMAENGTQKGEQNPGSKLTDDDIAAIRAEYMPGVVSQYALAEKYGVCQQVISGILRRRIWRHVD